MKFQTAMNITSGLGFGTMGAAIYAGIKGGPMSALATLIGGTIITGIVSGCLIKKAFVDQFSDEIETAAEAVRSVYNHR